VGVRILHKLGCVEHVLLPEPWSVVELLGWAVHLHNQLRMAEHGNTLWEEV